jgi:AraC-like DNA-binding protein
MAEKKWLALNGLGRRIGEDHQRAKFSNQTIDLLLDLRDRGWSYTKLSRKFGISRSHVRYICLGRLRCQTVEGFRAAKVCV